jgi:hypothetical protein
MIAVWQENDGVLSFEWVLLVSLLVIGLVVGITAARDAIIDELGDVGQAMVAVDQSYSVDFTLAVGVHDDGTTSGGSDTSFTDAASYSDCTRVPTPLGQGEQTDNF